MILFLIVLVLCCVSAMISYIIGWRRGWRANIRCVNHWQNEFDEMTVAYRDEVVKLTDTRKDCLNYKRRITQAIAILNGE